MAKAKLRRKPPATGYEWFLLPRGPRVDGEICGLDWFDIMVLELVGGSLRRGRFGGATPEEVAIACPDAYSSINVCPPVSRVIGALEGLEGQGLVEEAEKGLWVITGIPEKKIVDNHMKRRKWLMGVTRGPTMLPPEAPPVATLINTWARAPKATKVFYHDTMKQAKQRKNEQ